MRTVLKGEGRGERVNYYAILLSFPVKDCNVLTLLSFLCHYSLSLFLWDIIKCCPYVSFDNLGVILYLIYDSFKNYPILSSISLRIILHFTPIHEINILHYHCD